jgi:hypothetical protein
MFEIFLMVILLPISIVLNIILFIRGFNIVKQNEKLADSIRNYDSKQFETQMKLELMLSEMREIDLRGSFESDDEVGSVFTELKTIIETYKNTI